MDLTRAELRFGAQRSARARRQSASRRRRARRLRLQPGGGSSGGRGFFAWIDAGRPGRPQPIVVDFAYDLRGNAALSLAPQAGDTRWTVTSSWPHPSFGGDFLPAAATVVRKGFDAAYRIGNLALGRSLVSTGDAGSTSARSPHRDADATTATTGTDGTRRPRRSA